MRKSNVLLVVMLVASLLYAGAVQPAPAEAYQTDVHPLIATYARALYSSLEIDGYADQIDDGAYHEDELDVVWDEYGFFGACITITHFWDADGGQNDFVTGACDGYNAWQKARILWGMAVGEYLSGDLDRAFHYLGHVSHLLMDMAVPTHAHEDMHPSSDMYEDWLGVTEASLTSEELSALIALGPVDPPGPVHPLYWLFATTNQRADFYASEDEDGDATDPDGWIDFNTLESIPKCHDQDDFDSDCLDVVRRNSHLYAIRATAALFRLFVETVTQPALTVVIDEVNELECHDDNAPGDWHKPDYFVRIAIDNFMFRNEGLQIGDTEHIYPGWAFARPVALEGSIPLVIQLRDEDDDPDDDEISDIDPGGGRDLDMSIDLAKCIALEPGAISGDITGSCGTTLTSWGTDSDRSQIWFRIIPPNAPPEAAAGPDQIVDEADAVALAGSFTDPNVEDTHTFLWHLESSTNGQTVPNAHGQSLSFTAIDNGVYTFSFTVTDNHGASDTDEVVVTALNVAPVPIVEQLTDETGAEIGVDVPVALVGLEVDLEATFTDVGTLDTHTATLEWGDGNVQTTFGWFVDSTGGIPGFVAADHVYVTAGSYSIVLNVTDNDSDAGSASVPIEVVDAAGAVEAVAELLVPLAANPDIQTAIDKLIGNNDGLGDNGALDLLDEGNLNAALEKIKQALEYMEAAEASDPGLDLSYEKGLLALAAKSVALGAIADAQAVANGSNDLRKIATAEGFIDLGDDLLAVEEHVDAVSSYQKAVRAV